MLYQVMKLVFGCSGRDYCRVANGEQAHKEMHIMTNTMILKLDQ